MKIALEKRGVKVSKSTVRRVMAIGNLLHRCHKSPDGLTVADKLAMRPKNILARNFYRMGSSSAHSYYTAN